MERWPPESSSVEKDRRLPDWPSMIWRGVRGRCPCCNAAPIFDGFLKVHPVCVNCGVPLGEMPADDAPPYIAMLVVLHFVGVFVVLFYKGYYRPGIVMAVVLLVLLTLACVVALRMAKGAVIGVLLKLGLQRMRL